MNDWLAIAGVVVVILLMYSEIKHLQRSRNAEKNRADYYEGLSKKYFKKLKENEDHVSRLN